jgi:hypothetical protein
MEDWSARCEYCGEPYCRQGPRHRFCSLSCRQCAYYHQVGWRQRGVRRLVLARRACRVCGQWFQPYRSYQAQCSDKCRNRWTQQHRPSRAKRSENERAVQQPGDQDHHGTIQVQ